MGNYSYFPIFFIIFFLLFVIPAQNRRKYVVMKRIIQNKRKGADKMTELAKKFIGKRCIIHTFDGNAFDGTIKEISGSAAVIEDKKGVSQIINLDFATYIKEVPEKK